MITLEHIKAWWERPVIRRSILGGVLVLVSLILWSGYIFPPQGEVVEEVVQVDAYENISVLADAAVVYDLTTGEVLYEKNAEAQLPLASLTKLITIFAAADTLSLDTPVTITREALNQEGDSGFTEGEQFSFEDVAHLALVASSNDAAGAIALSTEKSTRTDTLASVITAVGLTQTYTLNGTGLDENSLISGGYGSARDMALLSGAFLERVPGIARATLEPVVSATSFSGQSYTLKNTNPYTDTIPGLRLSKTGFTDLAGGNLAIVFDAGIGHPIAIVVLGSTKEGRFDDVSTLVKATSAHFANLLLP